MNETGFGDDELTILSREELAERVRRRTADLENVMDTMADVLLKVGPDGRIRMANAAATGTLGYDRGEIVGKPIDHLLADEERNPQLSTMLTSGELVELLLREERVTDLEIYLRTSGGEVLPTSLSASVMRDDEGAIDGIVCVATDISERKAAEERAEFLHSLLRHDLGNKLTVTDGYLELLSETDLDDRQREFLTYAHDGIVETMDLVQNIRMLNRLDEEEALRPVDLASVLRESADRHVDLADRQEVTVTVDRPIDDGVRVVGGTLLKELFSNLIENALVHSGGSLVRVTTDVRESTVLVAVEDDGDGIPKEHRSRIVERGETAGETGGTGLGTYIAARIAETYGGELEVGESALGGARFAVRLERAASP